jgi:hypothetical protein
MLLTPCSKCLLTTAQMVDFSPPPCADTQWNLFGVHVSGCGAAELLLLLHPLLLMVCVVPLPTGAG